MDYPKEWNQLPKRERRKKIKKLTRRNEKRHDFIVKMRNWGIGIVAIIVIVGGGYIWRINRVVLPPTSSQGHIETSPPSHILDQPIGPAVQMHMLEHSDGDGPPGVIINYNCDNFECKDDLVNQLTRIAKEYPENVYLAPYPGMTEKIVLTREGKIKSFSDFNKDSIVKFIDEK